MKKVMIEEMMLDQYRLTHISLLRELFWMCKLPITEVASETGISRSSIYRYMKDEANVGSLNYIKLCTFYTNHIKKNKIPYPLRVLDLIQQSQLFRL